MFLFYLQNTIFVRLTKCILHHIGKGKQLCHNESEIFHNSYSVLTFFATSFTFIHQQFEICDILDINLIKQIENAVN